MSELPSENAHIRTDADTGAEADTDPLRAYAALYPEVVAAGSVRGALQAAADRAGLELAVELTSSPGWRKVAAKAESETEADGRSATVVTPGGGERVFLVDCWLGWIHMARGRALDLADVAAVFQAWVRGSGVRELTARWPFLETWDLAEAHERGETEAVAARWRMMQRGPLPHRDTELLDLIRAAHAQPRLRALSPGKSMCWFTLSRRAAHPDVGDFPRTRSLGGGRYELMFPDRSVRVVEGTEAAVAVILANLPQDLTP
ncbi:DUF6193 family natural product biosynthesis protein [Kitasatospora sp. NPDC028055]|uniref:DUF6193 family natural product biosynthesis protein n=1 Tax=Kitasatospora sp. NPDC028055 TaxID=3155653 RepID=UPI0033C92765